MNDLSAPSIQKRHFMAQNLSQVPIQNSGSAYYNMQQQQQRNQQQHSFLLIRFSDYGMQILAQTKKYESNYDFDPKFLSQSAVLRQQEQKLDQRWRVQDEGQYQSQNQTPQTDYHYQTYKKQQDEQLLQRFREYQQQKQSKQLYSLQPEILQQQQDQSEKQQNHQQQIQSYQNQQLAQQYQQQQLQEPMPIQQEQMTLKQNPSTQGFLPSQQLQQQIEKATNQKQEQKQLVVSKSGDISYKQRYQLNNNLFNPQFGISREVFLEKPQSQSQADQDQYKQAQNQIIPNQEFLHQHYQASLDQGNQQQSQNSNESVQQENKQLNHNDQGNEINQQNQLKPEQGNKYEYQNVITPYRVNPTSLSFNGVPPRQYRKNY